VVSESEDKEAIMRAAVREIRVLQQQQPARAKYWSNAKVRMHLRLRK
jgi:hypothetical protein